MSTQIYPFQTRSHRLVVLARSWYYHLKSECLKQGLVPNRDDLIHDAALEAILEQRIGWRYQDNPALDEVSKHLREIAIRNWDHLVSSLGNRLNEWLRGELPHLYDDYPPRRPRRWKPKSDAPVAQIIPFPRPIHAQVDEEMVERLVKLMDERWGPA